MRTKCKWEKQWRTSRFCLVPIIIVITIKIQSPWASFNCRNFLDRTKGLYYWRLCRRIDCAFRSMLVRHMPVFHSLFSLDVHERKGARGKMENARGIPILSVITIVSLRIAVRIGHKTRFTKILPRYLCGICSRTIESSRASTAASFTSKRSIRDSFDGKKH